MGETTIRVSEAFREWVNAHKSDGETMEEPHRRLTRGPHPGDVAGVLTPDEAEEAVDRRRSGDAARTRRAREAFAPDE